MGEMKFGDNYADLCRESGVNAGFQFEFYCERCSDTWRSGFVPYKSGRASGWLQRTSGLLGGLAGTVSEAVDGIASSGFGKARDAEFRKAVQQAERHFHRCAKCYQYVCDACWNAGTGLCLNCAPDAEVEIEAARAQGRVYAAGEKAALDGIREGKRMDTKRVRQLVCPECGAETKGAKFCPECGHKLASKNICPSCSSEITAGVKFCPECGHNMTA